MKLGELSALQEVGHSNLIALKSSNIEYFIPKAFAALFLATLVALVAMVVDHWPPLAIAQKTIATTAGAASHSEP